jgi:hypothetical protein
VASCSPVNVRSAPWPGGAIHAIVARLLRGQPAEIGPVPAASCATPFSIEKPQDIRHNRNSHLVGLSLGLWRPRTGGIIMATERASTRIPVGLYTLASACALTAAHALAQTPVFPQQTWTVQPAFADNSGSRSNISGVTCASPPLRACIVVNDVKAFAQLFSTSGTTITPGQIVGITTDTSGVVTAPHFEGAGHDSRFFYAVTTRSKDATGGQVDSSFLVARFSVDSTGRPPAPGGATGLEVSQKTRDGLTAGIPIPQIAGQQLTHDNADIEGIAVKDGVIHLGFRAPVLSGKAFIVSTPVSAVFGSDPLNPTVRPVALGPNTGILDLATVSDGLLVLAGPTRDLAGPSSLFHFNDSTGQLKPIAEFVEPVDRRAKGLLLLQDDPEFFRVLVLFDGVPDGGPTEYAAQR